jgi:hypothetical protein
VTELFVWATFACCFHYVSAAQRTTTIGLRFRELLAQKLTARLLETFVEITLTHTGQLPVQIQWAKCRIIRYLSDSTHGKTNDELEANFSLRTSLFGYA